MFKTALVTGGLDGIGRAVSEHLLNNNAKVAILSLSTGTSKSSASELKNKYGEDRVFVYECDVMNGKQFEECFVKSKEALARIYLVVNAAGVVYADDWETMIDVNLKGVVRGTKLGLAHAQRGGTIVNVASPAGYSVSPAMPEYAASKAAVIHLTRCYGSEFQYKKCGVRVVCVSPGATLTDMWTGFVRQLSVPPLITPLQPSYVAEKLLELAETAENGTSWSILSEGVMPSPTLKDTDPINEILMEQYK